MSSVIELAKSQFGTDVKWVTGSNAKTMSGEIHNYRDFVALPGIDLNAVIVKHRQENDQTREERQSEFPAYIMVSPDIELLEDDVIKTDDEIFIVKAPSLRHTGISGAVGSDPGYMRAELSLWGSN